MPFRVYVPLREIITPIPRKGGIEKYYFVLPLTSFDIFFVCIAQYGVILAELDVYELF